VAASEPVTIDILTRLYATVERRRGGDPNISGTARLFQAGLPKIAQKLSEEATETVVAALAQGHGEVVAESADLLYHLLVLWAAREVRPAEVFAELERRIGRPPKKPLIA
jgi:phosphoribosyl-ATP pyrophosphohydrolase